jgi:hypothetical protein
MENAANPAMLPFHQPLADKRQTVVPGAGECVEGTPVY